MIEIALPAFQIASHRQMLGRVHAAYRDAFDGEPCRRQRAIGQREQRMIAIELVVNQNAHVERMLEIGER